MLRRNRCVYTVILLSLIALCGESVVAFAQSLVRDRISQEVNSSSAFALPGSVNPLARAQYDVGRASSSTQLTGMTMYFKPSAEQQAALDALAQAQQTPGAFYHKWIRHLQYAPTRQLSATDLRKVKVAC